MVKWLQALQIMPTCQVQIRAEIVYFYLKLKKSMNLPLNNRADYAF